MDKFCFLVRDTLDNQEIGCYDDVDVAEYHVRKLTNEYLGMLLKKERKILNEMKTAKKLYVEDLIDQEHVVKQLQRQVDEIEKTKICVGAKGVIQYKLQTVQPYKMYFLPADFKTYKAYPQGLRYRDAEYDSDTDTESDEESTDESEEATMAEIQLGAFDGFYCDSCHKLVGANEVTYRMVPEGKSCYATCQTCHEQTKLK